MMLTENVGKTVVGIVVQRNQRRLFLRIHSLEVKKKDLLIRIHVSVCIRVFVSDVI